MPKPESEPIRPSIKEEARIRTGIEADPDTLELDDEWFAKARPASETHPHIVERYRRSLYPERVATDLEAAGRVVRAQEIAGLLEPGQVALDTLVDADVLDG